jgi:N-acetylglucosaminyl-diphospho-decaprenol L-rhamnosyltransferase
VTRRRVDVAIVTYNQPEVTVACLESVLATLPPPGELDVRVMVCDNGSTDDTSEVLAAKFPTVTLLREPVNRWYVPAANRLVAESDADYVLIMNPDTVVHCDVVTPLAAALDADPRLFLAYPETVRADGGRELSGQRFPTLSYEFALRLRGTKLDRLLALVGVSCSEVVHRVRDVAPPARVPYPMEFVWTTCALLRRSMAREIGPFDERFPQYDTDLVLSRRAADRGWYAWYDPDLRVTHLGGVSFTTAEKQALSDDARRRYYRLEHGRVTGAVFVVGVALVEWLKAALPHRARPAGRP